MPSKKEVKGKKNPSNGDEPPVAMARMDWAELSPTIPAADVFYFVYSNERAVLHVGIIEPILSVGASPETPKTVPVHTLGRFMLTPQALLRLKDQIDETYEGMKSKGAFNE